MTWYIHYDWTPEYFSREEWDSYLNGKMTLEEYSESSDKSLRQCYIDGYSAMGYDVTIISDFDDL
jgi:hypothetical protein